MVFSKFFDNAKKQQASGGGRKSHNRKNQPSMTNESQGNNQKRKVSHPEGPARSSKQQGHKRAKHRGGKISTSPFSDGAAKRQRPSKKKNGPPSQEALALSARLKELSQQKNLQEALRVFRDPANDAIRDEHHTCIIVDCCSRCGSIEEGERIVQDLENSGKHVNVETKTALLKGYSHSGQMKKAEALFESMSAAQAKHNRPNIRTLNTLLRGCLWSAATCDSSGDVVSGGVITGERAWKQYLRLEEGGKKGQSSDSNTLDASSYEYSISNLCQALRTKEAKERIEDLKAALGVDEDSKQGNHSDMEALAVSYLALTRAYTLLGRENDAVAAYQSTCKAIQASREILKASSTDDKSDRSGGKRAWRQQKEGDGNNRVQSNSIFRAHRLSELEADAKAILEFCETSSTHLTPRQLARRLLTRLLFLSGGGTTDLEAAQGRGMGVEKEGDPDVEKEEARALQYQLANTVYLSYGLAACLGTGLVQLPAPEALTLKRRECNRILGTIGLSGGVVDLGGVINFSKLFSIGLGDKKSKKKGKKNRPIDIELGAGHGGWIANQALENPSRDYVAVELRADRAWQIFARATLTSSDPPLENLCVVGAESGSFLRNNVRNGSVSTIFVNHPEPPTQTFGLESSMLDSIMDGADEPAHMLNSGTLKAAAQCLTESEEGRLVIVTDNRWYGRLLCATLVKVVRENKGLFFSCGPDAGLGSLKLTEAFPSLENVKDARQSERVLLFEGHPSEEIGHAKSKTEGGSYFDRLWRTGIGAHAEQKTRYVIMMKRQKNEKSANR